MATEISEEQLARRKAYLENTVILRVPKDQAGKFGVKVTDDMNVKDIASSIRDKFGITGTTRQASHSMEKMLGLLKGSQFEPPKYVTVTEDGQPVKKKFTELSRNQQTNRLRALIVKKAVADMK